MFTYVGFYIDGVGGTGTGISWIGGTVPVLELIIRDLRDLIER